MFVQTCILNHFVHSKKCCVVSTKFGSNMDKPKCWVKNVI